MNRLVIVVIPLLFISSQKLTGQVDSSSYKVLSGKIIDDSLGFALPSVHLWNESTRMGGISNDYGEFSIKVKSQDTLVFSAIGYYSYVTVVQLSMEQRLIIRLKQKRYEIGEVVLRRFRSYESFLYQVVHLDLPETQTEKLREYLKITSVGAALEADRERAVKQKLVGFGYTTPLGKGINHEKAFQEKINALEQRQRVIHAKFNREMVGEITHLDGDELSKFIAQCNFSEEYLYETDLYSIIEALYAKLDDFHNLRDTIPSVRHQESDRN